MDLGLAGRVYIVTGASRGLGFAAAECLVADGAHVVIASRHADAVTAAADRLTAEARDIGSTGTARAIAVDNAEPDAAERLVTAALERGNRLDGALISVGGPPAAPATDVTDEQWRESFETVFLGAVRIARTVAARLADHDGGAIAFVLSTSVRAPLPGLGISNGLRSRARRRREGDVRRVRPAPRTGAELAARPARDRPDARTSSLGARPGGRRAGRRGRIPLRRLGDPTEFGRVAAFLLSPAASYLTGIAVPVDGGLVRPF